MFLIHFASYFLQHNEKELFSPSLKNEKQSRLDTQSALLISDVYRKKKHFASSSMMNAWVSKLHSNLLLEVYFHLHSCHNFTYLIFRHHRPIEMAEGN